MYESDYDQLKELQNKLETKDDHHVNFVEKEKEKTTRWLY